MYNRPLDNWNVDNVIDMSEMFGYALAFNQSSHILRFNENCLTNNMFDSAHAYKQLSLMRRPLTNTTMREVITALTKNP